MTDTSTTIAPPAVTAPTSTLTPYLCAADAAAAIDWYDLAWRNSPSVSHDMRIVMLKSALESKARTSWIQRHAAYEAALSSFVRAALERELEEELGIHATIAEEAARIRHEYRSGSSVDLRFFVVREYRGKLENRIFRDMQWARPADLPSFDFLEADLKLVSDLATGKLSV